MPRKRSVEDRFWDKVAKAGPDDCWLWQGAVRPEKGFDYGQMWPALRAHRVSYEIHYGAIPDGMLVRHSCDTPRCCNPAHLSLGTTQDNMDDKKARGRCSSLKGAMNPSSTLSDAQVEVIRQLRAHGLSSTAIAKECKVHHSTVLRIAAGTTRTESRA